MYELWYIDFFFHTFFLRLYHNYDILILNFTPFQCLLPYFHILSETLHYYTISVLLHKKEQYTIILKLPKIMVYSQKKCMKGLFWPFLVIFNPCPCLPKNHPKSHQNLIKNPPQNHLKIQSKNTPKIHPKLTLKITLKTPLKITLKSP